MLCSQLPQWEPTQIIPLIVLFIIWSINENSEHSCLVILYYHLTTATTLLCFEFYVYNESHKVAHAALNLPPPLLKLSSNILYKCNFMSRL